MRSPCSNRGNTFAPFRSSGKIPVSMERLKIVHSDSANKSGHSRRSLAEILSKPVALDLQCLDKRERTVERSVGFKSNLVLRELQLR